MKYIFYGILLLLLFSCELYGNRRVVALHIPSEGLCVISCKEEKIEFYLEVGQSVKRELLKGYSYSITYYPIFDNEYSNYPWGSIINSMDTEVYLERELGIVSQIYEALIDNSIEIPFDRCEKLIEKLKSIEDPWVFNKDDIRAYLLGKISIGSISRFRSYTIPELEFLRSFECENQMQRGWYKSITKFRNGDYIYRLQLFENGEYYLM